MTTGDISNSKVKDLAAIQLGALCKALEHAIPDKETLEQIVLFELGERLSNIPNATNANTYRGMILSLVQWAESKRKIRKLVTAASIENPLHPELQQFVQRYVLLLLELDPIDLESDLLSSLIQCLQSINDFTGIIWLAFTKTLPDFEIQEDSHVLKEAIFNNELSGEVKWLILLDLFLHTWRGQDSKGQFYIVKYVQNLAILATEDVKHPLTNWLEKLPVNLKPPSKTSSSISRQERPSDETLKSLQAYFLIVVEPPEITIQTGLYGVNGYLMTRLGSSDQFMQIYPLNLKSPARILNPDAKDEIEPDFEVLQQTKGVFCTLQQVEDSLPDWLVQAQEVIDIRCSELQSEYELDFRSVYDLGVEFWLPFEYLTAAVDTWKIYGKPVRLKQRRLVIGEEYRVVVRSYDRFSDSDALNELNRMWQELTKPLQDLVDIDDSNISEKASSPISSVVTHPKFHSLDCWSRAMALQSQVTQACLALALACPFDVKEYEHDRDELFAWVLARGIPIALWSRKSSIDRSQQAMEELLTSYTSSQIDELLERIKQLRKSANEQQLLGKHLAIWCDEPKHLMELKQFLRKPGRLSA